MMASMNQRPGAYMQASESQIDPNSFGAIYLQQRIGALNRGRAPNVEHQDVQSYGADNPLSTHVHFSWPSEVCG